MSVYTPLTLAQVQTFATPFSLNITHIEPIQGGVENTNYFIFTDDQREYVLTVFEDLKEQDINEFIPALYLLGEHGVPVAVPLKHSGKAIHPIANKPAQIAPRLAGGHPIPNVAQVSAVGKALAEMHLSLKDVVLQRQSSHDKTWWKTMSAQIYQTLPKQDQDIFDTVFQRFDAMQAKHPQRPSGLIHQDLFRDNTLYVGDALTGILDFSELTNNEWLLDLSITLNDFCTDFPHAHLDQEKVDAFLSAYQTVRPFTADEQACLAIYLAMAGLRFWVSRLEIAQRNQAEGRTGEDILQKDPEQMRQIVIDRLKATSD